VTLITPLLGVVCHRRLENLTILASAVPEILSGVVKIQSGSRDFDHASFKGDLSSVCLHAYKIWPL